MTRSVKEESYTKVLSDISLEISSELASTYGPIISQESFNPEDVLKHSEYNVNNHNTLKCYALYIHFSNAPSQEAFESAYKCLTHEINNFEDASFIAMRSWVIFMASPKAGISSGVATPNAYRTAHLDGDFTVEAAERIARYAVSLERDNDDAQNILGRIQLSTGKLKQATLSMRRAVEANPADPDNLMDLAVLLAHSGAWEESLRLADQAISRHPNPPGWYYLPYLFEGLVTDDAAKVQSFLQTNLIALSPINMIYHFAAASMAGDEARVKQLTPQLVDFFSATDINPKLFLMDTIYSAEICDAVWQTLVREGIGYS
jgi:tetratricopeptide (TPR) repeat protein